MDQPWEAEPTHGGQDSLDMPVGSRAIFDDLEQLVGRHHGLALQDLTQGGNGISRQLGKVGQGARLDLAVLAIALTKKNSGRGVPIGYGGDIHANILYTSDRT